MNKSLGNIIGLSAIMGSMCPFDYSRGRYPQHRETYKPPRKKEYAQPRNLDAWERVLKKEHKKKIKAKRNRNRRKGRR